MNTHDLVIRNAVIIDGSAQPRFNGDLAVIGDGSPAGRQGASGGGTVAAGATPGLAGVQQTRIAVTLPVGARTVTVVGDFNGWDTGATRLSPVGDHGEWAATVPLAPGRHVYAFVVDGVEWRVDPLAPQVPDAGFGPANALIVDGGP